MGHKSKQSHRLLSNNSLERKLCHAGALQMGRVSQSDERA
jgi:hypothetical protein